MTMVTVMTVVAVVTVVVGVGRNHADAHSWAHARVHVVRMADEEQQEEKV